MQTTVCIYSRSYELRLCVVRLVFCSGVEAVVYITQMPTTIGIACVVLYSVFEVFREVIVLFALFVPGSDVATKVVGSVVACFVATWKCLDTFSVSGFGYTAALIFSCL